MTNWVPINLHSKPIFYLNVRIVYGLIPLNALYLLFDSSKMNSIVFLKIIILSLHNSKTQNIVIELLNCIRLNVRAIFDTS